VHLPRSADDFAADLIEGLGPIEILPPAPSGAPQSLADLLAAAGTLTRDKSPEMFDRVNELLRAVARARLDPTGADRVLEEIKRRSGDNVAAMRKTLQAMRREMGGGSARLPARVGGDAAVRPEWANKVQCFDNGEPKPILVNALLPLREDPAWRGVVGRNDFTGQIRVRRCPPWPNADWAEERDWIDDDELKTTEWVQAAGICATRQTVFDAVASVANEHRFHPVRDWFESFEFDGVPRLDDWLQHYCGVDYSPYTRAVGARFLISAVARIFDPGCKVDCVLILEGKQGLMKSTALRTLFDGDNLGWFTDEIADLGSKDAAVAMRGVWCIELAELDAMRRAEVSRLKAFLTRTEDRYRPPYGRQMITVPRQCVFAGTVNDSEYLRDPTGGRRFWPVRCGKIDIDALRQDRIQLFAEAVARYRNREKWFLHETHLIEAAEDQQAEREAADPWQQVIQNWLDSHREAIIAAVDNGVTTTDVLGQAIGKPQEQWTHYDTIRVGTCLRALGWTARQVRIGRRRENQYFPPG
jgi:putative DNA primase/helicase